MNFGFRRFREHQKASENQSFKALALLTLSPENLADLENVYHVEQTRDDLKYNWTTIGYGPIQTAVLKAIWDGKIFRESLEGTEGKPDIVALILDKTNFYAENGGQIADEGLIETDDGCEFAVSDVKKIGKYILHIGTINEDGKLSVGNEVSLNVDFGRRSRIAKNHTGTHALNFALRKVLGDECDQKGSLVEPFRARFDFSFSKGMTDDEIKKTEEEVRQLIRADYPIYKEERSYAKVKEIEGLRAVFGEVYPDPVRIVSIGASIDDVLNRHVCGNDYSVEFCGGTHLEKSGEIGEFVIISEESISRGVRRLVIATGIDARDALAYGEDLKKRLKSCSSLKGEHLDNAIIDIREEMKNKRDGISLLSRKQCNEMVDAFCKQQVTK